MHHGISLTIVFPLTPNHVVLEQDLPMKSQRLLQCSLTIVVIGLFSTLVSSATIVTFDFTGNVNSIYDPNGLVAPTPIHLGSPVQASFRFDTATPDWPLYADDPTRGSFVGPGWLKVNINGLNFERTTGVQVDSLHGANGGQELFQVMALQNPTAWPSELPIFTNPEMFMAFWETAPPYDLLSNAELPTSMDFSRADIYLAFVRASTSSANNYEIRFSLTQVPEPGVTSLLAFGLFLGSLRYLAHHRNFC